MEMDGSDLILYRWETDEMWRRKQTKRKIKNKQAFLAFWEMV
jgi:hypothetical protein